MNEEILAKCACAHCGGHIAFPIDAAGMTVSCPHCGQAIPLVLDATPPLSDKPSAVEIIAAFDGAVPRSRPSVFYDVGLILVTVMMILLPLAYLAIIAAVGWECSGMRPIAQPCCLPGMEECEFTSSK